MENSEQLVKLSPDDLALLQRMRVSGGGAGCFVIAAMTIIIVAHLVYRTLMLRSRGVGLGFFGPTMIEWVVVLLFILVGLYTLTKRGRDQKLNRNIDADLKEGYKKVIARRVESQQIEGHEPEYYTASGRVASRRTGHIIMSYLMKIDGEDYSASEELYMKVRPGDTINSHVAPNSGLNLYHTIGPDEARFPASALRLGKR